MSFDILFLSNEEHGTSCLITLSFSPEQIATFCLGLSRKAPQSRRHHSHSSISPKFSPRVLKMMLPPSILGLPTSLILLLSAQITNVHAETLRLPTAIRKLGTDAGEKITHEYFAFGDQDSVLQTGTQAKAAVEALGLLTEEEEALLAVNSSASLSYRAPLARHFDDTSRALDTRYSIDPWEIFRNARIIKARLERRDYACPTGTSSCSAIGYPNSCCQTGATCVKIEDTGLGPVGCCPSGESCTGTIACSGEQQGCSSESGGGCCIPGWSCASVGCEFLAGEVASPLLQA